MENKIDRLFQKKLVKYDVKPSSEAWDQVRSQLDRKRLLEISLHRSRSLMRIAAAIALLAVSTFLIFQSREIEHVQPSANITPDQPIPLVEFQWNLPEPEILKESQVAPVYKKKPEELALVILESIDHEKEETIEGLKEIPIVMSIDSQETFAALDPVPNVDRVQVLPQFRVQITYKASEIPNKIQNEKTRVGKLLAKARQIKPGEMLASIRATKNDFFSGKRNHE